MLLTQVFASRFFSGENFFSFFDAFPCVRRMHLRRGLKTFALVRAIFGANLMKWFLVGYGTLTLDGFSQAG
jgi:hypothetical protein